MSNYHIKGLEEYFQGYRKSVSNPELFWEEIAEENFLWRKKWDKVLDFSFEEPSIQWFRNAKLNVTENCLDRYLVSQPNKTALIFEPNNPGEEVRTYTYKSYTKRFVSLLMF